MNRKIKRILFISIGFNLLFIFIIGFTFVKLDKVDAGAKKSNMVKRTGFHYYERTSLFNELPIPPGSIVFLGDSLTFRTEWSELFPGKTVINRGIGSDTTAGVLDRLDGVITAQPEKIFLLIGVNDLKSQSVSATIQNYSKIINRVQSGSPNTEIFIQSLLPVNNKKYGRILTNDKIKKLNNELRSLADDAGVQYIDLYSNFAKNDQLPEEYTIDGIHLTGKGYILWRETIKKYVD
ncbi:GDSL-type esterase/lipase family protein [Siminovitchia fortis]|uniref:GDSL-type esterase/lipase family protein n=1 Tax=Siminovitchia fortis TaxID=254758 RepID=UPI00164237D5|nr:GDSL-type esterase/lipase family protein [Siminovitchia fortis]